MNTKRKQGRINPGRAAAKRFNTTDRGLILLELSGSIIAADSGAAEIFRYRAGGSRNEEEVISIGREALQALHSDSPNSEPLFIKRVRLGAEEFTCRAYMLESRTGANAFPERVIAVLLERVCEASEAFKELATQYRLTKREQQALRGVASGLSSKALAARMNIAPSTLRAFLRLIKVKMGVSSRAGIMAKILEKTKY